MSEHDVWVKGRRIAQIRRQKKIRQPEFAKMVNIPFGKLQELENRAEIPIPCLWALKICKVLEINTKEIAVEDANVGIVKQLLRVVKKEDGTLAQVEEAEAVQVKEAVHEEIKETKPMAKTTPAQTKTEDVINHPSHYVVGGYECLDLIEALELDYLMGNVFKYVWRAGRKSDELEDLKKARVYLERKIARLESK